MRNYFNFTLVLMGVFCSCSNETPFFIDSQKDDSICFTASIEGGVTTRATLVANMPSWEVGDVVSLDGHEYSALTAGVSTVLSGTGATESVHHAFFPASIYNGGTPTLPAVQTYEEGKFNMPMYAESATEELVFKNICSVLAVSVSNEDIAQVKAIKVASTSKSLSGAFSVTSDGTMTMTTPNDASATVTLSCATAVTMTSDEKVFYIAIPAQTYSDLKIFVSSDGTSFTKCMATKKAEGLGALARNKILNISYETNAVQLWTDGPFFATTNIPAEIGVSFKWCATSPGGVNYGGDYDYDHDTCSKFWGSAWRMPTIEEWQGLKDNCFSTQTYSGSLPYCFTFSGNGNKLSFRVNPNTATSSGGNGSYWSSTTSGGSDALCVAIWCNNPSQLYFDVGHIRPRSYIYDVQAVLR